MIKRNRVYQQKTHDVLKSFFWIQKIRNVYKWCEGRVSDFPFVFALTQLVISLPLMLGEMKGVIER